MSALRPIVGVPAAAWASIHELPPVRQDAYHVDAAQLGFGVSILPIVVTRIHRAGGYVVYAPRGAHAARFDVWRIAPFEEVHSTLGRATAAVVAHLREQLARAHQEEEAVA